MTASALVIGGGIAGMSAALVLSGQGVAVDLIDADPEWRTYGAGISVTGTSLRALDDLGLLDEVRRRGHVASGFKGRSPDGGILFEAPLVPDAAPINCSGGIMRSELHEILSAKVKASPVAVRLGTTVGSLDDTGDGVDVAFSDGSRGRFDLVIGADGIYSQTRSHLFPDAPAPVFTGQGCWRAVAPRPEGMTGTEMFFGGPVKLGFNPVSPTHMYLRAGARAGQPRYAQEDMVGRLKDLLAGFGSYVAEVRDGLGDHSLVNYRPLEWQLLADPWYKGRVVLVGDAAHATTPHMASGAGMAIEDAGAGARACRA
jgi:2-polyprenyl-6-methoxyphenol hydroxylase-like FAD-dependent oxidoreductase